MQKWEYLFVDGNQNFDNESKWEFKSANMEFSGLKDMFEKLGLKGWELTSTSTFIYGRVIPEANALLYSTSHETFYFKRPFQSKEKQLTEEEIAESKAKFEDDVMEIGRINMEINR